MSNTQGEFKFNLQLFADEGGEAEPAETPSTEFSFDSFLEATGRTSKTPVPEPTPLDEETEEEEGEEGEEEEEEEEEVVEAAETPKKKSRKSEGLKGTEVPLLEIKQEEVPRLSLDEFKSQASNHYLSEALKQWVPKLQEQGKLGNNPTIDEIASAAGPKSWNELENWVRRSVDNDSQNYVEKVIKPYVNKAKYNEFTQFLNSFSKVPEFADFSSYLPKMKEAHDEFVQHFPQFADTDPRVSLPALYAFVKNREFNKVIKKQVSKKAGGAPVLEGRGARHKHGKGAGKADPEYDLLKQVIEKNKNYPLAGIF